MEKKKKELTPAQREALQRNAFKKGEKHPNQGKGRPSGLPALRKELHEILARRDMDGTTTLTHILDRLIAQAKDGNLPAIDMVLRYAYPPHLGETDGGEARPTIYINIDPALPPRVE